MILISVFTSQVTEYSRRLLVLYTYEYKYSKVIVPPIEKTSEFNTDAAPRNTYFAGVPFLHGYVRRKKRENVVMGGGGNRNV